MKIYVGFLDRFGYELMAAGSTEKEVINSLMRAYRKAYIDLNGSTDTEYKDCYSRAREDINIYEMAPGKVEWR